MKVKAYMLAFCQGEEREIEIPDEDSKGTLRHQLEMAFYYGQNDFQPRSFPSVSVGDVIDMGPHGLHLVKGLGFKELTVAEFEEWKQVPRLDRSMKAL